ncbi:MAG: FliA/WhiG family RNA polymerase sigma factor [Micrococcales bacterium]|nr:FliA/WhiG family RNA polymerase sigma factor [Micrococcales bacterium]
MQAGVGQTLVRRYPARPGAAGLIPTQRTAAGALIPTQRTAADVDPIDALWASYKVEGSVWAREQLILHYVPLVTAVAGRIAMRLPSTVDQGDLVSYGMFGLIDAIEKYETDRAVRFESYASARVRGAILDELRALDWVPRSVRSKSRAIDRAFADLENELHRSPTQAEVAERLGLTTDELAATRAQVATGSVAALDEVLSGEDQPGGQPLGDRLPDDGAPDPLGEIEAMETSHLLARAIESLNERERLVVVLYYYERRTLAQIGRVLGVTESRVSQMHNAAVGRLRSTMREAEAA